MLSKRTQAARRPSRRPHAAADRRRARPLHRRAGRREEGRRHRAAQPLAAPAGARGDPRRDLAEQHHPHRPDRRRQDRDRAPAREARRRAVHQGRGVQVHRGRLRRPRRRVDGARSRRQRDRHGAHRARDARSRTSRTRRSRSGCSTCCFPCRRKPSSRRPPEARAGRCGRRRWRRIAHAVRRLRRRAKSQTEQDDGAKERYQRTREKLKQLLLDGQLEEREVEVEVTQSAAPMFDMMVPQGAPEGMENFTDMLQDMLPKRKKKRTVKVSRGAAHPARAGVRQAHRHRKTSPPTRSSASRSWASSSSTRSTRSPASAGSRGGPDVSREGVQRDLLPIVEGSNVQTKYGMVKTDHVLFVAAGAFHVSKPSDLIPELQGRFPIRVELKPLTEADFVRIMTEPENALTKQYVGARRGRGRDARVHGGRRSREIARIAAHGQRAHGEHRRAPAAHGDDDAARGRALRAARPTRRSRSSSTRRRCASGCKAIVEDEDLRKYIL